jgi:putative NIF3 family GTP cyclohydrolase 1 type 2
VGAGMIGTLEKPMEESEFLVTLKKTFNCGIIRHTKLLNNKINTVAVCGGSGSFLLKQAIRQNADIFITGDFKYHEFFDAENSIVIADIGHYESEQFTSKIIADKLKEKFTNFAIRLTEINTNPINYF